MIEPPPDDSTPARRLDRWLRGGLPICVVLTLALGIAKVYRQKEHHPPSYDKPVHVFEGYMAIDGHAAVAAGFRDWIRGDDPGARALRERLEGSLHPSAIAVPLVVGALGAVIGSIPIAFLLLSAAATCLQVWLAAALCARFGSTSTAERRLAALLTCGHVFTIATCAQLYLDPFVAVLVSIACLLTARWMDGGGARSALLLAAVQGVGLFTKISYVPMLAIPCLALATSKRARSTARIAIAGVFFAGLPLAAWWLYLRWLGDSSSMSRESEHLWSSWKLQPAQFLAFLGEMFLLFQAFPLFVFRANRNSSNAMLIVRWALFLLLFATWTFRLPAVHRLYLPEVSLLAALAATPAFQRCSPRVLLPAVVVYLAANYGLAASLLLRGGS